MRAGIVLVLSVIGGLSSVVDSVPSKGFSQTRMGLGSKRSNLTGHHVEPTSLTYWRLFLCLTCLAKRRFLTTNLLTCQFDCNVDLCMF